MRTYLFDQNGILLWERKQDAPAAYPKAVNTGTALEGLDVAVRYLFYGSLYSVALSILPMALTDARE